MASREDRALGNTLQLDASTPEGSRLRKGLLLDYFYVLGTWERVIKTCLFFAGDGDDGSSFEDRMLNPLYVY